MMKLFMFIVFVIGLVGPSQAQDFKFGLKGGVNFATLNGDAVFDSFDGRTGYHIGAVAQLGLGGFAIQPEIVYSAQGIEDTNIDYLNIPILAKLKFAKILSLEAGPQFGLTANGSSDLDDLDSFDISAALGASVEFSKFFVQLRYNFGLTDAIKNVDAKNAVFQVSAGYYFF